MGAKVFAEEFIALFGVEELFDAPDADGVGEAVAFDLAFEL